MRLNKVVLLAGLLGFVLGAGVMRLTDRSGSLNLTAEPVLTSELTCAPVSTSAPATATAPESLPAPVAMTPPVPKIIDARLRSEAAPLSEPQVSAVQKTPDDEDRLQALLERPLPKGREVVRNDRDDGGVMTYEQLDDGTSINRTFSATGTLRAESMYTIGGEKILKKYYDSGRARALSWTRGDGDRTDVRLSPDGLFEGRQDTRADGTKIVSKYDASGNLLGRWRILKNGRSVAL